MTANRLRHEGEALADPLPALLAEAERIAASVALGVHGRRRAGPGETFWEYRRHRREDGAARVDWRRSARGDALFVRENEWEAAQSVWFWRDGGPGLDYRSHKSLVTKRDRASVIAIALASLLTRGGERVGVLGETDRPRGGRKGFDDAARALVSGSGTVEAVAPGAAAAHAKVVLASDFYEPPEHWRARIAALAASGLSGAMIQVIDPAEESFPFSGRVKLVAPAAGSEILVGRAQSLREGYQRRFAAHRAALQDIARSVGWTFAHSRTDRPASEALLAVYAALAPQPRR